VGKTLQWVEDELDSGTGEPNGYVVAQRTDSPSISRTTFFEGIDGVVVQWLDQYAEQLMTWKYRGDIVPFAQVRVTKVEAALRARYANASTPEERRRLIRNVCCLISAAVKFAYADLANSNTLTIKTTTTLNFLNWHTAMVLQPLKNGIMSLQEEQTAYYELIPKRERKSATGAAEADEPDPEIPEPPKPAAKKRAKKRAAEPEPQPPAAKAPAKKRAKKTAAVAEADDFSGPKQSKPAVPKAPKSKAESTAE